MNVYQDFAENKIVLFVSLILSLIVGWLMKDSQGLGWSIIIAISVFISLSQIVLPLICDTILEKLQLK